MIIPQKPYIAVILKHSSIDNCFAFNWSVASAWVGDGSVREHILNENFFFSNMLLHAPAFRLCKNIFLCVSFSLSKNCFRNFIIF